jgi:hypothetical protein
MPGSRTETPRTPEPLVAVRAARRLTRRLPHRLHGLLLVAIAPVLLAEVVLRLGSGRPVIGSPERDPGSRRTGADDGAGPADSVPAVPADLEPAAPPSDAQAGAGHDL